MAGNCCHLTLKISADLHMHSTYSDGKYSVEQLIDNCIKAELKYFSITDHDTLDHVKTAKSYLNIIDDADLKLISGTEVTTNFKGISIHILAYNVDEDNVDLKNLFKRCKSERLKTLLDMGEKLSILGLKFNYESHLKKQESPGRPHLADLMIRAGYCRDMSEAFDNWLGHDKPAYIKKWKPDAEDVIQLIHSAGGKAFIAHVGVYDSIHSPSEILELNLDGIEIFHPDHTGSFKIELVELARKNGFFISGGSDYHGWDQNVPEIGTYGLTETYINQFLDGIN